MSPAHFFCFLFFLLPLIGVALAIRTNAKHAEQRLPLYAALRAFAEAHEAEVEEVEVAGTVTCEAHCFLAGVPCSVRLGWEHSDFTLRLRVQLPGLSVEDFEDCWDRSWVRYLKRDFDQRLYVSYGQGYLNLSGPSHSLREVFAEVDRAEMARLFGVSERGSNDKFRRVSVGEGSLAVRVEFPVAEHIQDLEGQLRALVRLAQFSCPPFGEAPRPKRSKAAPKTVGSVTVSVQAGQRCAYCREDLVGDAGPVKTCAACNSSLHAACLEEHGGCCTVGCRNNPRR